jgi:hypothetical protein
MARARRLDTETWLARLRALEADPHQADALAQLLSALKGGSSFVVARAARIIEDQRTTGVETALVAAWARLAVNGAKVDKGCEGKLAIALALDQLDFMDPAPFLKGVKTVQVEPSFPRSIDTAAPLRARCAFALVRMAWPDALQYLADLLADEMPAAREGAARGLAYHGGPGALALLRFKLRLGDDDDDVDAACMAGLMQVNAQEGVRLLAPLLDETPSGGGRRGRFSPADVGLPRRGQLAAFALAESRDDLAVPVLVDLLSRAVLPGDLDLALTALAGHRSDASRRVLFDTIARGSPDVAAGAVAALRVQRFDPRTEAQAREAAGRNAEVDLSSALDAAFED